MSRETHSGAQRASRRRTIAFGIAIALATVLVAAPVADASTPSPSSSSTYLSVERYYLTLVNCSRTGGWVLPDGTCKGYGSGHYSAYHHPLTLNVGISNGASRPFARYLAMRGACDHFLGSTPAQRLRRAGFTSYRWAENLGCGAGRSDPYKSVLGSHLYFQAEKFWHTTHSHWINLMSSKYTSIGIGVGKSDGRVRLVTDLYHP